MREMACCEHHPSGPMQLRSPAVDVLRAQMVVRTRFSERPLASERHPIDNARRTNSREYGDRTSGAYGQSPPSSLLLLSSASLHNPTSPPLAPSGRSDPGPPTSSCSWAVAAPGPGAAAAARPPTARARRCSPTAGEGRCTPAGGGAGGGAEDRAPSRRTTKAGADRRGRAGSGRSAVGGTKDERRVGVSSRSACGRTAAGGELRERDEHRRRCSRPGRTARWPWPACR